MKFTAILILSVTLSFISKAQNNESLDSIYVEYVAVSRGIYIKVEVKDKKVRFFKSKNENPHTKEISKREWDEMVAEIKKINLEELANFEAPTEKRLYDGAATANLEIILHGKNYRSMGFDHGFPPAEIKEIIDFLIKLTAE